MKTPPSKPAGRKPHPSPQASTIPRDLPAPICPARPITWERSLVTWFLTEQDYPSAPIAFGARKGRDPDHAADVNQSRVARPLTVLPKLRLIRAQRARVLVLDTHARRGIQLKKLDPGDRAQPYYWT